VVSGICESAYLSLLESAESIQCMVAVAVDGGIHRSNCRLGNRPNVGRAVSILLLFFRPGAQEFPFPDIQHESAGALLMVSFLCLESCLLIQVQPWKDRASIDQSGACTGRGYR
jgi:hypothetical protein